MQPRPNSLVLFLTAAVGLSMLATSAVADQWSFVGPRYQAMGGTGVAFADDSVAVYWNPANLAWKRGYDAQFPVGLNANIENDALAKLSDLIQTADDLGNVLDESLNCDPVACLALVGQARSDVMNFLIQLADYDKGAESVHFGVNLGLAGRVNNYGFSAMSMSTGTIFPDIDIDNLAIGDALTDLVGTTPLGTPVDSGLADTIATQLAGGGIPSLAQVAQAENLVWLAEQAGANTSNANTQSFLTRLAVQSAAGGGGDAFQDNQTGAVVAGLSTQEFAFTYAHKVPMPFRSEMGDTMRGITDFIHNRISLGGNLKYMLGIGFAETIRYSDGEGGGGVTSSFTGFKDPKISHNFGLDIGLSVRPVDWLQFGMVARNVNGPKFDIAPAVFNGKRVTKVEVPAQVRMGIALLPINNLTLAFDFDATENKIVTLPGFKSRIISLGAEYAIPFGKNVDLALRLGGYSNVAGVVKKDWTMTGGLGLRLWQFVLDLSAGGSFETEKIRTGSNKFTDIPPRLNAGLTLKWEKSL